MDIFEDVYSIDKKSRSHARAWERETNKGSGEINYLTLSF